MKKRITLISTIAGITAITLLTSGVAVGCSKTEETAASEVTEETTEATEEETTTESTEPTESHLNPNSACPYDPEFVSTNGELEGQEEYMRFRDNWGTPSQIFITDLEQIEDEETRALAQTYYDNGYAIYFVTGLLVPGDLEFEFNNGFDAQYMDGTSWNHVSIWKMNETLYNYFILEHTVWWNDYEGDFEDDGTVITRSLSNPTSGYYAYYEFNRDTGYMTFYEEDPRPEYWPDAGMGSISFEDENLQAAAQDCIDRGLIVSYISATELNYYSGFSDGICLCNEGFRYSWSDGHSETYVEVVLMNEDTFDRYIDGHWIAGGGTDLEETDDGTIITITLTDSINNSEVI